MVSRRLDFVRVLAVRVAVVVVVVDMVRSRAVAVEEIRQLRTAVREDESEHAVAVESLHTVGTAVGIEDVVEVTASFHRPDKLAVGSSVGAWLAAFGRLGAGQKVVDRAVLDQRNVESSSTDLVPSLLDNLPAEHNRWLVVAVSCCAVDPVHHGTLSPAAVVRELGDIA